jgi:endonuclease YncB( thermonuclease family)
MSAPYDQNTYRATVIKNVDGDTSWIEAALPFDITLRMTIRWYGVNSPEIATPEGKAALAWVEGIMPAGSTVLFQSFKSKKEKYGRFLGTFFLADGTNVNDLLVSSGHAVPYFGGKR